MSQSEAIEINEDITDAADGAAAAPVTDTEEAAAEAKSSTAALKESKTETQAESGFPCSCRCCHCKAMRCAHRRARFLESDEGRRRLHMKLATKNFFMDLTAMSKVRKNMLAKIYGGNEKQMSQYCGFPVSLYSVEPFCERALQLSWWVHNTTDVDRYVIYVNGQFAKSIFDPKAETTIVVDVDINRIQNLYMEAVPIKICMLDILDNKAKEEEICCCNRPCNFWKASEFLYLPPHMRDCPNSENSECICDTFT